MKKIGLSFLLVLFMLSGAFAQTFCNSASGNIVVYSNYDGGVININVDQNIPNLKIGVCTYEACQINITGAYAGNVTAVRYAGYIGTNDNCNTGVTTTTINGVPANISTILFAPSATLSDAQGYPSIICGYSCGTGNQGGCNTAAQVAAYFVSVFGGSLRSYFTQYACWNGVTLNVSAGGNCCPNGNSAPGVSILASSNTICPGDCINFTDQSSGSPTSWAWTFEGGSITSSSSQNPQNICFNAEGTYDIQLSATNGFGTSTGSISILVEACDVPGCTYAQASNYNPNATIDNGTCLFDAPCPNCLGDLDNNGFVGVNDLLIFIGVFGTPCPN